MNVDVFPFCFVLNEWMNCEPKMNGKRKQKRKNRPEDNENGHTNDNENIQQQKKFKERIQWTNNLSECLVMTWNETQWNESNWIE